MTKEEKLDKYDIITNAVLTNIYTISKDSEYIELTNINIKDKEHLFFIRIATIAKDVFDKQLAVSCSFWEWVRLSWKFRKISRFKLRKSGIHSIDVGGVLDFMRPSIQEELEDENANFAMIYEVFYESKVIKDD